MERKYKKALFNLLICSSMPYMFLTPLQNIQYKVFDFIYFFVPYLQKEQKETTKEKISNYIVERSSCIQIA